MRGNGWEEAGTGWKGPGSKGEETEAENGWRVHGVGGRLGKDGGVHGVRGRLEKDGGSTG